MTDADQKRCQCEHNVPGVRCILPATTDVRTVWGTFRVCDPCQQAYEKSGYTIIKTVGIGHKVE